MKVSSRSTAGRLSWRGRLAALAGGAALAGSGLLALPAAPVQAATCGPITGISPASGPTSGGTVATITGSGFTQSFCAPADGVVLSSGGTVVAFITGISNLSDTSLTVTMPAEPAGTYDVTVQGGNGSFSGSLPYTYVAPCPKPNFRWHYRADGSAGSWSATTTQSCQGSLSMGPQAMEGNLHVTPGTTLQAGYDFTVPGNKTTLTLTVSSAQVSFAVTCVSGATPSTPSLTVTMPDQSYTFSDSEWHPSGDQSSTLSYQGSVAVPDLCGGGALDLAQGGTFTATLS